MSSRLLRFTDGLADLWFGYLYALPVAVWALFTAAVVADCGVRSGGSYLFLGVLAFLVLLSLVVAWWESA